MLKKYSLILIIYIVSIILGTFIYTLSFNVNIFGEFDYLFFRSGILLLVSSLLISLLLIIFKYKLKSIFSKVIIQDIVLIFFVTISLNWFIYGLIPFNVSRSNSMIILKYMYDNKNNPKPKIEIKNFTEKKYFDEYDAVGVRLGEQIASGNIMEIEGKYCITTKGVEVVEHMLAISSFYNLKNNFLKD